jgi:hypothetical protein
MRADVAQGLRRANRGNSAELDPSLNKHVLMASGAALAEKPPPVWNGDGFFFMRLDGRDYPPRRMKEAVSGRCDAINWTTLLFAQFID